MSDQKPLNEKLIVETQRDKTEAAFKGGLRDYISKTYPAVERVKELSFNEFKERFRDQSKPAIFEGLLDNWPAMKKWNLNYFKEKCGTSNVMLNHYDKRKTVSTTFAEFVDNMNAGNYDEKNPVYLQEWHILTEYPEFQNDITKLSIQEYDFRPKLYGYSAFSTWIGQKNSATPLHKDVLCLDVLQAQIVGRKHWVLFGPDAKMDDLPNGDVDLEKFVKNPNTTITHTIMGPGDFLYLPANWYHRVELLDNCISLGMHAIDERSLTAHMRDRMQDLLPMALNAEYLQKHHQSFYQISYKRNMAMAKLMGIDLNKLRKAG